MTITDIYMRIAGAFAIATFVLIAVVNPSLPSMRRCADMGASLPSALGYSVFKGFLWPVSLVNSVVIHDMRLGTWLLNRYDPFSGSCR